MTGKRTNDLSIGPLEELALLAVRGLQPCFVGDVMTVLNQVGYNFGATNGSIYNILDRLEQKGCVTRETLPKRPIRGGRERYQYMITERGIQAIQRAATLREQVRKVTREWPQSVK